MREVGGAHICSPVTQGLRRPSVASINTQDMHVLRARIGERASQGRRSVIVRLAARYTLFPYTTLFRSQARAVRHAAGVVVADAGRDRVEVARGAVAR